jgi:DNA-directed RNA polymerase subunit RPC12/RpoP
MARLKYWHKECSRCGEEFDSYKSEYDDVCDDCSGFRFPDLFEGILEIQKMTEEVLNYKEVDGVEINEADRVLLDYKEE